jgi:hypothetical protein
MIINDKDAPRGRAIACIVSITCDCGTKNKQKLFIFIFIYLNNLVHLLMSQIRIYRMT